MPYLRSDDASLRTGAIDALRAMPAASRPYSPALLADADADVRLLSCELARGPAGGRGQPPAVRSLERETEKNVCGGGGGGAGRDRAAGGLAGAGALRRALRRRSPSCCSASRWRPSASSAASRDVRRPRGHRRRNSARSANSSTGAPACSSPRASATTSSGASPSAWPSSGIASFATYFAYLRSRCRRRDREVHQRLHGQRDLFLSRGASASLPVDRPAGRAGRRKAAGRGAAHLVGAVRHRRRTLFDRHVAARELAGGRRPGHRDRRLRHRHRAAWRRRATASSATRALMRLAPGLVEKYFDPDGTGPLAHRRRPARSRSSSRPVNLDGSRPKPASTANSTSSSAATC